MRIYLILVTLLTFTTFFAQKTKEKKKENQLIENFVSIFQDHNPHARDFHALGHSLFFDLNLAPLTAYKLNDTTNTYSRLIEYSFYHFSYFFRINFIQPSHEKAFSLNLNPGIGLGQVGSKKMSGFGMTSCGILIGFEKGAGSTYLSEEEKGGFFRLGAEITYMPIFYTKRQENEKDIRYWINPIVSFGFRKENSKQNLIETNFKIGWGVSKEKNIYALDTYTFLRPVSFRMSFVVYLDH